MLTRTRPVFERRDSIWQKLNYAKMREDTLEIANLNNKFNFAIFESSKTWINSLSDLDPNSAVVLEGYVVFLFRNKYLTDIELRTIEGRFNKLHSYTQQSTMSKSMQDLISFNKQYPHEIYGQIPNITAQNQNGEDIAIPSLLGKYDVVLYTYKISDPNYINGFARLKALYNSQPNGRIKVITLCLDGKTDKWKEEIAKHGDNNFVQLHTNQKYKNQLPEMSLYNRWGDRWNMWVSCTNKDINEVNKYLTWINKFQINQYK